eukprot:TRINITY_DN2896_c0_g1_i1.p1 TRINITY_DN2896_c0_g1~~TRINITY_DN2896_c0_g1_i1.p1  ORF type:complete len:138 (-),score=32.02 TRINITY_DN2896_c0_g1_i1:30-443(-)
MYNLILAQDIKEQRLRRERLKFNTLKGEHVELEDDYDSFKMKQLLLLDMDLQKIEDNLDRKNEQALNKKIQTEMDEQNMRRNNNMPKSHNYQKDNQSSSEEEFNSIYVRDVPITWTEDFSDDEELKGGISLEELLLC